MCAEEIREVGGYICTHIAIQSALRKSFIGIKPAVLARIGRGAVQQATFLG